MINYLLTKMSIRLNTSIIILTMMFYGCTQGGVGSLKMDQEYKVGEIGKTEESRKALVEKMAKQAADAMKYAPLELELTDNDKKLMNELISSLSCSRKSPPSPKIEHVLRPTPPSADDMKKFSEWAEEPIDSRKDF